MECAPSYVAGALLRGDQRRRTAEDNGNPEISGFLTDWIVMKIADFRFVTNMLLTNRCRCDYVIQRCIL